jgi:DNA-binding response OmpR family regulator
MKRTRHILYIEDDAASAELVKMYLEYQMPDVLVETRTSAAGAEEALNQRCFDLLIIDLCLPGELGTDIARRVLERDDRQPIHLVSAYRGDNCRALASEIGLALEPKLCEISPAEFLDCVKCKLRQRPCSAIGRVPLRPIQIIPQPVRDARAAA